MTTDLLAFEDIDTGFVPRLRTNVAAIRVDDETVLFEEDTGGLHQLDAIATVVCSLFDGSAPIGTIVGELATAFGADPREVEVDVLKMTRRLGRHGLLEGVQGEIREDVVEC